MRPAGDARWCPRHGRLECARQRSRGRGPCHGPAIKGTGACRFHAGTTVAEARRAALTAWAAVPDDRGVTPLAAVAGELGLAWRRARLLGEELRRQVQAAAGDDDDGGGLVGHVYSASAAADGIYPTGEHVRALAELEAAERERVVKFAATAHTMGVYEHQVAVARELGGALTRVLDGIFDDLSLTPAQRALVPVVVPVRLRALPGPDDDPDDGAA
jgi:hypothetical protein